MKREVLVVPIQVGGVRIGKGLVEGTWSLYRFILGVQYLWDITLQFVTLRLYVLDGETYHRTANLDSHSMLSLKPELVFKKDDSTELWGIVLNVEAVLLAFDDSMAATNTNIVDTNLTLMTTAKLELRLFVGNS